jgi:hypothetical protein
MFESDYILTGDHLLREHPDKYITPTDKQIFIDIDSRKQYKLFKGRYDMLDDYTGGEDFNAKEYPSRSGLPHRHIIVTFSEKMTVLEQLFLQSFLMSDPERDIMSYIQHKNGDKNPILLRKVKNGEKK